MGTSRASGMGRLTRIASTLAVAGLAGSVAVAGGTGRASAAGAGRASAAGPLPDTITTVVGGVGGPARATAVALGQQGADTSTADQPCGVSAAGGYLYMGNGLSVRKIDESTDWLTTPAGEGTWLGLGGNGALATSVAMNGACGTAVDGAGNLLIAQGTRVRLVAAGDGVFYGQQMKAGHIYTVAGDGQEGFGRSRVPATKTHLFNAVGVAVDHHGNLVIADEGMYWGQGQPHCKRGSFGSPDADHACDGAVLRVVAASSGRFYGREMVAGDIYTVAGSRARVRYSGDGGPADEAALGLYTGDVRVDGAGNLVLADSSLNRIRVVAEQTGTFYRQKMTAGDIYTVAGDGKFGFSGDGGPATSAELANPTDVALDAAGNLVISDTANNRIRVVAASSGTYYGQAMTAGDIDTVAGDGTCAFSGDGGRATSASLCAPEGVTVDAAGNIAVADATNGRIRVVAAATGTFYRQAMSTGHIYTVAGNGKAASGDGGPATAAEFTGLTAVAVGASGNLVVNDSGRVMVSAAHSGTYYGRPMKAGHIYTVAGDGQMGFSGMGGLATKAVISPEGVAVDAAGDIYIADENAYRVLIVPASTGTFFGRPMTADHIYVIAGDGSYGSSGDGGPATKARFVPYSLTLDGAGNLLIPDRFNNRVRLVAVRTGTFYGQKMTAGDIYTVAGDGVPGFSGDGGPATAAEVEAYTVAIDAAGNLVLGDATNRVRVVAVRTGTFYGQKMTAGDIYTVAGTGSEGISPDGTPALRAKLYLPGTAVDGAGNLVLAEGRDNYANYIEVVAVSTGQFYGKQMTAGDVYRIAGVGTGTCGFSGDGGPATRAEFCVPGQPQVDAAGNVLFPDVLNGRLRMITG